MTPLRYNHVKLEMKIFERNQISPISEAWSKAALDSNRKNSLKGGAHKERPNCASSPSSSSSSSSYPHLEVMVVVVVAMVIYL